MNIQLQYVLNVDEFAEFQLAFMKHRKALRQGLPRYLFTPGRVLSLLVFALIFSYCIVSAVLEDAPPAPPPVAVPSPPPSLGHALLVLLPYFVIPVVFFAFFMFVRRSKFSYRQVFSEFQKLYERHDTTITDTRFEVRQSNYLIVAEWPYFIRCIETKSSFLLFMSSRTAHIVPKRAFPTPESLVEFRAFALANIGNLPIGFPVQPGQPIAAAPVQQDKEPS